MKTRSLIALATLLLAALATATAEAQCQPFGAKTTLTATKLGDSVGAIGASGLSVDAKCRQLFGLTVSGKIADGETLAVVVTKGKETFRIGGVKMFGGFGQLVLDSFQDVSDVFPVTELTSVQVVQVTNTKLAARIVIRPWSPPRVLLEGSY